MPLTHEGINGIVRNSRDQVINLRGELRNPQQTAAISVTDAGTSFTVTANKRHILVYNIGTSDAFFGGSDVASTTGVPILAGTFHLFENVSDSFQVFLIMSAAETTTLRRVEF